MSDELDHRQGRLIRISLQFTQYLLLVFHQEKRKVSVQVSRLVSIFVDIEKSVCRCEPQRLRIRVVLLRNVWYMEG